MDRMVGKFETAPAVANEYACFNLVGVLAIENAPQAEILRQALAVLRNHHPALRSRMEKNRSAYRFRPQNDRSIPLRVENRADDHHWISETEFHLNTPVDWKTGPLLNCTFLENPSPGGRAEILFAFHHSIVDAISLVTFLHDFLTLCSRLQSGDAVEGFEGYAAPPAVEEMFPQTHRGLSMRIKTIGFMLRQMTSEMAIMRKTRGKRKPPIVVSSHSRVLMMGLSAGETEALVKTAREHNVTLNSVQHAAILMAVRKHLYGFESLPLKYILFQNLRPYLSPPLDPGVLGSYIAMIQLVIDMDPGLDFWTLCREINRSVRETGRSGDKFMFAAASGTLLRMLFRFKSFRMAATAMNYSGVVDLQTAYGDIRVVDVRGFASNFGLGPEFSAQTLIFDGQLNWNIIYLETDMNEEAARTISGEIKGILLAAAREDRGR